MKIIAFFILTGNSSLFIMPYYGIIYDNIVYGYKIINDSFGEDLFLIKESFLISINQ